MTAFRRRSSVLLAPRELPGQRSTPKRPIQLTQDTHLFIPSKKYLVVFFLFQNVKLTALKNKRLFSFKCRVTKTSVKSATCMAAPSHHVTAAGHCCVPSITTARCLCSPGWGSLPPLGQKGVVGQIQVLDLHLVIVHSHGGQGAGQFLLLVSEAGG